MSYYLKNYDDVLLEFNLGKPKLEERVTEILYVNEEKKALFPYGLDITPDGITKWLRQRNIPKNRAYVNEILSAYGLAANDLSGIIDVCKGLSVNDSFWVVSSDFQGTFKEYNLYQNPFSDVLALVAYTGYSTSIKELSTSPEFTTAGMLPKAWRRINNKIYLYKGGTKGYANAGMEPYSEFYAAQVARKMGLNHVTYGLEKWKGILASTCELFTDIDTAYVPIGTIVTSGGIDAVSDYYIGMGEEYFEEFASMLVYDALIINEDRHYGNFGLLRDNKTGRFKTCAPIFDNGYSLFATAMEQDLKDIDNYSKTRMIASCGLSHDDIVKNFCGELQQKQLKQLINFKLVRHEKYNWDEDRFNVIERFIQRRVEYLLSLDKTRLKSRQRLVQ